MMPTDREEDPRNPDRDEPIGDPGMKKKKTGRNELPGDEEQRKDETPTKLGW